MTIAKKDFAIALLESKKAIIYKWEREDKYFLVVTLGVITRLEENLDATYLLTPSTAKELAGKHTFVENYDELKQYQNK